MEELKRLKEMYPKGTKVELVCMDDPQAPPVGTVGEVNTVDDAGTIHVKWQTGSSLGLLPGIDKFKILKESFD